MHLDQILPLLSTNVATALEGLAVFIGLDVIAGSLRAAIRDKDFSPREIARFVRSQFFSPEYGALLGLLLGAGFAPDVASRAAILALVTASASALTVRVAADLWQKITALAGFPTLPAVLPAPKAA